MQQLKTRTKVYGASIGKGLAVMKKLQRKPSLDRPATYEITVPGVLDDRWSDWDGEMTVTIESDDDGQPVSTLTGTVDQAALHGILRRLYFLGLPLISVICIACGSED